MAAIANCASWHVAIACTDRRSRPFQDRQCTVTSAVGALPGLMTLENHAIRVATLTTSWHHRIMMSGPEPMGVPATRATPAPPNPSRLVADSPVPGRFAALPIRTFSRPELGAESPGGRLERTRRCVRSRTPMVFAGTCSSPVNPEKPGCRRPGTGLRFAHGPSAGPSPQGERARASRAANTMAEPTVTPAPTGTAEHRERTCPRLTRDQHHDQAPSKSSPRFTHSHPVRPAPAGDETPVHPQPTGTAGPRRRRDHGSPTANRHGRLCGKVVSM